MHNAKKLNIWIDGMDLVDAIYNATDKFPKSEIFGLASQMQRAAVSIPSNIAEGTGKGSNKEFVRFLGHALGSSFELETQVLIATRRQYLSEEESRMLLNSITQLQRRICSFRDSLEGSNSNTEIF